MAGETSITIIGNLTADPELRFTPQGHAVAKFSVACTPRTFDRQTNEWKDGNTTFHNVQVWRQYAENVTETLRKGMKVIVKGDIGSRTYETDAGEKRTVFEIEAEEVGVVLRNATAVVTKNQSNGSQPAAQAQADPWASATPAPAAAPAASAAPAPAAQAPAAATPAGLVSDF